MKTIQYLRLPFLGAALFAMALFFQPAEAEAKDGWKHGGKGYQKRGYAIPPGQAKKYYRNDNVYYYRDWNPPRRYEYYEGRRGYWQNQNGVQVFLSF